ncbi:MAG: GTPase, partial [Planctomycetota bacterium]
MNPADTVVAISSPPGAAPRGIVRITGADAFAVARRVLRGLPDGRPRAGAHLALGLDLPGWPLVEDVLALLFVAPRSYTGDDLVELHLPGCGPLLEATVEALLATDERERVARTRVRAAGPGEFTWRAVLNGRLDVAQAEAVGELVAAPDAVAAARCVAGLVPAAAHSASLASRAAAWREALAQMLARTELALDFSDDEDLTYVADPPGMQAALRDMLAAMQAAGAGSATPGSGSPHTGLPDVVLAGPANAGKSSLFNRLVASSRATRALVTRHAGTTRDATCAELDDPPMRRWDTAGVRGANDGGDASAEGLALA